MAITGKIQDAAAAALSAIEEALDLNTEDGAAKAADAAKLHDPENAGAANMTAAMSGAGSELNLKRLAQTPTRPKTAQPTPRSICSFHNASSQEKRSLASRLRNTRSRTVRADANAQGPLDNRCSKACAIHRPSVSPARRKSFRRSNPTRSLPMTTAAPSAN